jgi:hypothetical protein
MNSDSERFTEQQSADRRADVERRAFELYLERGCGDGQDLGDWLTAERELTETGHEMAQAARQG